jgi:hypothetical protein
MRPSPSKSSIPHSEVENERRPEGGPEGSSSWAQFVPEALYDLIGRVIPGTVIVAAILHGVGGRLPMPLTPSPGFTQVLIVITGYLFGLIGDVTADATVDRVLARVYGTKFSFWRHFDHLDAAKRRVLLKMWSERACLWNLLLGWLCLWVIRPSPFGSVGNAMWIAVVFTLTLLWLRWDWTCRARARTWAEEWKDAHGSFRVRGDL